MGLFKPHILEKPHGGDVDPSNIHHLMYMLKARENQIHASLKERLAKAFLYTKVGKKVSSFGLKSFGNNLQEKGIFNSWMYQEQDKIQAFAKAYADRLVGEAFIDTINSNSGKGDEFKDCPIGNSPLAVTASADLEPMLKQLLHLHLLTRIEEDLSFFLLHGPHRRHRRRARSRCCWRRRSTAHTSRSLPCTCGSRGATCPPP